MNHISICSPTMFQTFQGSGASRTHETSLVDALKKKEETLVSNPKECQSQAGVRGGDTETHRKTRILSTGTEHALDLKVRGKHEKKKTGEVQQTKMVNCLI